MLRTVLISILEGLTLVALIATGWGVLIFIAAVGDKL